MKTYNVVCRPDGRKLRVVGQVNAMNDTQAKRKASERYPYTGMDVVSITGQRIGIAALQVASRRTNPYLLK